MTQDDFDAWLDHCFDHPVDAEPWWAEADCAEWSGSPLATLRGVIRLFHDPIGPLSRFTDAQIGAGLWWIISPGLGEHFNLLDRPELPLELRVECVRACATVFESVFAPRCAPVLSHLDEPAPQWLNAVCYMWWDIAPLGERAPAPERERLLHASIKSLGRILALENIACQEAALHGLGHLQVRAPDAVADLVDRFVEARSDARRELLAYARAARSGCVL